MTICTRAALLPVLLLIGVSASAKSPWPMFRHDNHHTGRSEFTGPQTPDTVWTFQANDGITASVTIGHDGTLYVGAGGYYQGGGDSSMYAIHPDGSLKWQYKTGQGITDGQKSGIFSSVAIGPDSALYFGCLDANLYCLEDSGTYARLRWKNNPGGWPIYGSPVVRDNGFVYAGSLNFRFYCFNPAGEIEWYYPTNWCVFSSPILGADGVIHVGSKDHNLWTFRDSTSFGSVVWKHKIGTFYDGHLIDCSPSLGDNGTIYFGSDQFGATGQTPVPVDTAFWAVNPDGTRKWAVYIGNGVESSPAVGHDGTIYFGSYNGNVYAVDDSITYGKVKWTFPTGAAVDASPTVDADGVVYIGSRDSTMYALNPDGSVKWSLKVGGEIESSVTIDDQGYAYFGSFDGKLYKVGTGGPDVGVKSVDLPTQVTIGSIQEPAGRISNYRGYPLTFEVVCVIEDDTGVVYADTLLMPNVEGGQYDYAVFAPWTVPAELGVSYQATITTLLAGDENATNNIGFGATVAVAGPTLGCADINADGVGPDIADLVYLVNYMFNGGPPLAFPEAADMNNSGSGPDIADLVYLVNYMFNGGPEPECPF
ncbi:MAG: PQQ-binding-like beta-propeller repeat protein [bacterium]